MYGRNKGPRWRHFAKVNRPKNRCGGLIKKRKKRRLVVGGPKGGGSQLYKVDSIALFKMGSTAANKKRNKVTGKRRNRCSRYMMKKSKESGLGRVHGGEFFKLRTTNVE